jgi:hypothetical protein
MFCQQIQRPRIYTLLIDNHKGTICVVAHLLLQVHNLHIITGQLNDYEAPKPVTYRAIGLQEPLRVFCDP